MLNRLNFKHASCERSPQIKDEQTQDELTFRKLVSAETILRDLERRRPNCNPVVVKRQVYATKQMQARPTKLGRALAHLE
jgi:hypothetical protein